MKSSIKLAIVDDHPLVIQGVMMMLSTSPHIEVVAHYTTGTALLQDLKNRPIDILLLDVLLPDYQGHELCSLVSKTYTDIKIIALTSLDTPAIVKSMLHNGCKGFLLKGTDQATLIQAIEAAYNNEEFIEPSLKENLLQSIIKPQATKNAIPYQLTQREQEVLDCIVTGETTQAIADKLFISARTVETHRITLLKKLSAKNTAELVSNAFRFGLVQ
jgi:DNA-binding NarL/FixJ family response regulator